MFFCITMCRYFINSNTS